MQSETGFPSSHQLKSYVASKSRLKLAARAVLSADAGLLINVYLQYTSCVDVSEGDRDDVPRVVAEITPLNRAVPF